MCIYSEFIHNKMTKFTLIVKPLQPSTFFKLEISCEQNMKLITNINGVKQVINTIKKIKTLLLTFGVEEIDRFYFIFARNLIGRVLEI